MQHPRETLASRLRRVDVKLAFRERGRLNGHLGTRHHMIALKQRRLNPAHEIMNRCHMKGHHRPSTQTLGSVPFLISAAVRLWWAKPYFKRRKSKPTR